MSDVILRPKYNMPLGLETVKGFSPDQQIDFYRYYLEHLSDNAIKVNILKKAISRSGSLGLLPREMVTEILDQVNFYEEEHFHHKYDHEVKFSKVTATLSDGLPHSVKSAINLLGVQGNNCQATFNHRFIYSVLNVPVVVAITKASVHYAAEGYIIDPEFAVEVIAELTTAEVDLELLPIG